METTDFTTQDGRGSLQKLRYLLARAVSTTRGNTAKVTWLNTLFTAVIIDITADVDGEDLTITADVLSNNSKPGLISELRKAASESVIYGGDYKTQLIQDLNDADTILTA